MNFHNPTLRAMRSITLGGTLLMLAIFSGGCSKTELANVTNDQAVEERAAGGFFLRVYYNGSPKEDYHMEVHCGQDLVTDADGLVTWGAGCALLNRISVNGACFLRNKDYYLKPSVGLATRHNLKINFSSAFPSAGGTIQLIEYDYATDVWTVNGTIVGSGLAQLTPQAGNFRLPRCTSWTVSL